MNHKVQILILIFLCSMVPVRSQTELLTTDQASVSEHYRLAWELIMDQGYYGPAEVAFSKAYLIDTLCILPALNYARIIKDTELQKRILKRTLKAQDLTYGERLLRNCYAELVRFTIQRSAGKNIDPAKRNQIFHGISKQLQQVVKSYPDETYVLAEYIEIIHTLKGPQQALDSLYHYEISGRSICTFLKGYELSMKIELEHPINTHQIKIIQRSLPKCPKPYLLWAEYYYAKEKSKKALRKVNKALKLDNKNMDAIRLKQKIQI